MAKIKKSIFDKLDDSTVKYAFFITYLIGALVIVFGSKFPGQYTSTIILFAADDDLFTWYHIFK